MSVHIKDSGCHMFGSDEALIEFGTSDDFIYEFIGDDFACFIMFGSCFDELWMC